MATAKIPQVIEIVDPFDGLTFVTCANERLRAALAVISDRMLEAVAEITDPKQKAEQFYQCWLLLEMAREAHDRVDAQLGATEVAFYNVVSATETRARVSHGA